MSTKKGIHFEVSERKLLLRIFDIVVVFTGLFIIGTSFDFDYFTITKENWTWSLVLAIYILIFGTIFELYDLKQASLLDATFKNIILTASLTVLLYLLTPFFTPFLPDKRIQIIYFYLAIISTLFIWRLIYIYFIESPRFYKKGIIIGAFDNAKSILDILKVHDQNYKIIGYVNSESLELLDLGEDELKSCKIDDISELIKEEGVSEIIIAIDNLETITPEIYNKLILLLEQGYKIREYAQLYEDLSKRVPVQFVGKDFYKYFPFSRSNQNKLYLFFHRMMDVLFSVMGITLGLFLLPVVLLGNLLGNRGPLFYKQERVGLNGEPFKIIKFRTMIKNAESDGVQWATKDDVRVTSFGRIMRNLRIDEIPQFINVLKGEMSMIGPRPERPHFVKELSELIPFYETRHSIKPGLSGWAQVNSRYGDSIDDSLEKLQYDLYYIKHRSFFIDAVVIIKTFSTVIYYRGQ